jgi:hypothetical protein
MGVACGSTRQKRWENVKLREIIEEPRIDKVTILKLLYEERFKTMNLIYLARDKNLNQTFMNTVINILVL